MKAILMSIKPKYMAKILNGEKTIEIRKRFPLNYRGWVYIYCTKEDSLIKIQERYKDRYTCEQEFRCDDFPKMYSGYEGKGKVVARFYCDNVEEIDCYSKGCYPYPYSTNTLLPNELEEKSCLTSKELENYLGTKDCSVGIVGYDVHISQLEIFDTPKELSEFKKPKNCNKCWCVDNEDCIMNKNCPSYIKNAPQSWCYVEVNE